MKKRKEMRAKAKSGGKGAINMHSLPKGGGEVEDNNIYIYRIKIKGKKKEGEASILEKKREGGKKR